MGDKPGFSKEQREALLMLAAEMDKKSRNVGLRFESQDYAQGLRSGILQGAAMLRWYLLGDEE